MNVMSQEYWVYHMPQTFQIEPLSTPDLDLRTWHLRGQVSHLARWSRRSQGHIRQFRKARATKSIHVHPSPKLLDPNNPSKGLGKSIGSISVTRENSAAGSFLKDIYRTLISQKHKYIIVRVYTVYIYIHMLLYLYMHCVYYCILYIIIPHLEKHSSNIKPKTCTLTSDVIPAEAKAALITPTTSHFGHQILWPCKWWNAPAKQWLEKNGKGSCFQIISMSKTRISENWNIWNKGQIGHVADNLYMATCSKIQHDSTIRIWARKAFHHQSLLSPERLPPWNNGLAIHRANDVRLEDRRQTTHPGFDSRVQVKNSNIFKLRNGFVWKCWVNIPNEIAI